MSVLRAVSAELHKLLSLPGVWIGALVTVLGTAAVTVLNANYTRAAAERGDPEGYGIPSAFDTAFAAAPLGVVGAVVVGVLAIGSEYAVNGPDAGGGRQVVTSLTATPRRGILMVAKAVSTIVLTASMVAVALPVSVAVAHVVGGDAMSTTVPWDEAVSRTASAGLYWILMGLVALGITALVRSQMVPLVVLVANSSVVSIPVLLAGVTPLAYWLPDMAGRRLFHGLDMMEGGLDAVPGAIVMAAWAVLLVAAGTIVFARRDA